MKRLFWGVLLPIGLICGMLGMMWFEAGYQSAKGYFPWMSRWDYLMLGDKLRIVND